MHVCVPVCQLLVIVLCFPMPRPGQLHELPTPFSEISLSNQTTPLVPSPTTLVTEIWPHERPRNVSSVEFSHRLEGPKAEFSTAIRPGNYCAEDVYAKSTVAQRRDCVVLSASEPMLSQRDSRKFSRARPKNAESVVCVVSPWASQDRPFDRHSHEKHLSREEDSTRLSAA